MRFAHYPIVSALFVAATIGCGGSGPGKIPPDGGGQDIPVLSPWLGMTSVVKDVVQLVNAGTNWVLSLNQVKVSKVSDVRKTGITGAAVADFKIEVTNGTNTFDTVAKDVPCDNYGIPTEKSVDALKAAVEDIKAKIKRLQN